MDILLDYTGFKIGQSLGQANNICVRYHTMMKRMLDTEIQTCFMSQDPTDWFKLGGGGGEGKRRKE